MNTIIATALTATCSVRFEWITCTFQLPPQHLWQRLALFASKMPATTSSALELTPTSVLTVMSATLKLNLTQPCLTNAQHHLLSSDRTVAFTFDALTPSVKIKQCALWRCLILWLDMSVTLKFSNATWPSYALSLGERIKHQSISKTFPT